VPSDGTQAGDPFPHRDRLCHYQRAPAAPAQGRVVSPHSGSEFTRWPEGLTTAAEQSSSHPEMVAVRAPASSRRPYRTIRSEIAMWSRSVADPWGWRARSRRSGRPQALLRSRRSPFRIWTFCAPARRQARQMISLSCAVDGCWRPGSTAYAGDRNIGPATMARKGRTALLWPSPAAYASRMRAVLGGSSCEISHCCNNVWCRRGG
jgi:hypothetical protein